MDEKQKLITKIDKQFNNSKSWTNSKSQIIIDMTKLWAMITREIGYCQVCGTTKSLEAHHLIPRANHIFRIDRRNGICLCTSHHTYSGEMSAHGACRSRPSMLACDVFLEWLEANKDEQWNWYQRNKHIKQKGTLYQSDYESMYEKLLQADTPEF